MKFSSECLSFISFTRSVQLLVIPPWKKSEVWCCYYTWELLPYLAVLESATRTAEAGSSIHTFFRGLKLQTSAVLWSCCQTADLGSSMAALQCCDPSVPQTADLGSFMAALGWWQKPKQEMCHSNCQPRQFDGHFEFKELKLQTYGCFSVMRNFISFFMLR